MSFATSKTFDIIINSKYNPAGSDKVATSLEKAMVKAHLAIGIFDLVGGALLNMARAGDPERFDKLSKSMDDLQASGGRVLMQVLGPLIDKWTEIIKLAETGLGPKQQADEFFSGWIKNFKESGKSAEDTAVQLKAMSDAAEQLTQKAKDAGQLPFWVVVKDAGINMEKLKTATADASSNFSQYINALRAAGIEIKDLNAEIKKFADYKGIKLESPIADMMKGGEGLIAGMKSIEDQVTAFRTGAATQRTQLLQDIAIAEGRRLQDVARQNARQLKAIEQSRTDALRAAADAYASTIANIDQSSADNRARIEEDFRERMRQIQEGSGASIEDAIQRRDARALAKALQSQAQQISQAERDHEKQLRDNEKAAEQQKAQAAAALEQQQKAADEAAQRAIEAMREANRQAAEDQKIAWQRQQQDFDLEKLRELGVLTGKLGEQYKTLQTEWGKQQALYKWHLGQITAITDEAVRPSSALAKAIVGFVNDAIGDALGALGGA
jgi:hypothetical protein